MVPFNGRDEWNGNSGLLFLLGKVSQDEAIMSATVKADRLFIESYQTLFCLTTHHVFKSKSVPFISEEKILILFF